MYIVTTSKRIYQITALAFSCLALMSAISINGYYRAYVAQPKEFSGYLNRVVRGELQLEARDVRLEQFAEQELSRVLQALIVDLEATNMPQPSESAELLLADATGYLADDDQMLAWLNTVLAEQLTADAWIAQKQSLRHWQIRSGELCLALERHGRWQLAAMTACQ